MIVRNRSTAEVAELYDAWDRCNELRWKSGLRYLSKSEWMRRRRMKRKEVKHERYS